MSLKWERRLGLAALMLTVVSTVLLFVVTPERLPEPETADYLLKLVLYPSVLVLIRALWKTLLDNKIRSKEERAAEMSKIMDDIKQEEEAEQ